MNDRDEFIKEYVMFYPNSMHTSIKRHKIITTQFEFKPMMFQMLQAINQFVGVVIDDPHIHLKKFTEVDENFNIPGVEDDAFKLRLFLYFLRDRAKAWLNSFSPNFVKNGRELAEKLLLKYFPSTFNVRKMNAINTQFWQK